MQTSYSINMTAQIAGQIQGIGPRKIITAVADEELPFGYGVVQGAKANSCKLPDADTDKFLGVVGRDHKEHGYPYASNGAKHVANDLVNVVTQADIVVVTTGAVTKNAAVYLDVATGKFTETSTNNIATGAVFAETVAASGIARITINRP